MSKRDSLGKSLKNLQTVRNSAGIDPSPTDEPKRKKKARKSNAGRPSEGKGERKPAVFRLEPESIATLGSYSVKVGRSKSDIINELIMTLKEDGPN